MTDRITLEEAMKLVTDQVQRNQENWDSYNSLHETYGLLAEEFAELFDIVRQKQRNRYVQKLIGEFVDIAAVSIRGIVDICNEETIRK